MKVSNEIKIREVDGTATPMIDGPVMTVRSHWNDNLWVVLLFQGQTITVTAEDLQRSINNATNWRY